MDPNFQLIAFPLPEYLAQYFAFKIKSRLKKDGDKKTILLQRSSYMGKLLFRSLEKDLRVGKRQNESELYLKVSVHSGNNYQDTPRASRHFLHLDEDFLKDLTQYIKEDFEEALFYYCEGAEFAHVKNGWDQKQKRRGIRRHAIQEFCKKNRVSPDKRTFDSLFKMIQRYKKRSNTLQSKALQRLGQSVSF